MRLKKLAVKNFRRIHDLEIDFPPGLSVIVGANNVGKTTVIDALRLVLFSSRDFDALRINEDDFRRQSGEPIEIACIFTDLTDADEVWFQECLVDKGDGTFDMKISARAGFNESTRRANVTMWGGETEGGRLPTNLYDRIAAVYLQPLRNPESGLKPGRYSQISRLIDCLANESEHANFEQIVRTANERIRKLTPVENAKSDIDRHMVSIAGEELTQTTELVFSDPKFHRIIAGLEAEIDGLPFGLNGLGFNNLVFTAATLGTLKRSASFSYRSILIEEPEAHLHPQLQLLLLRHLAKAADSEDGSDVQVIASSHSPILASQAPVDSVIVLHEDAEDIRSVSVHSVDYRPEMKRKLERFLDATRAELFFARRILMVEGIAEVLLMPILARIAGGSLKESAVTVLNAAGLNFNTFIPLLGIDRLRTPVAILVDGDDRTGQGVSATVKSLREQEVAIPNLHVESCQVTFEHELAKSAQLLPAMLAAFEAFHPIKGPKLRLEIEHLTSGGDRADRFLDSLLNSEVSKGEFAQELADRLEDHKDVSRNALPDYILRALLFLGVVEEIGD